MPKLKVGRRVGPRKALAELHENPAPKLKPQEFEIVLSQKSIDLKEVHSMLLHVEQQVSTPTGAIKVCNSRYAPQTYLVGKSGQVLATSPNVRIGGSVTPLSNIVLSCYDILARQFAINPKAHEPAGPQKRHQNPPPHGRVGEVMEHAHRFDYVKGSADRLQMQNVPLRVLDIVQSELTRFSNCIAETGEAEINGEYPRSGKPLCCFDSLLTCAAACEENFDFLPLFETTGRSHRKQATQELADRRGFAHWSRFHPARIRVFLVLPLHQHGRLITDRSHPRNGGSICSFLPRFEHLLVHDTHYAVGPAPILN